jgi:uncharacterized membrane protein (UPF0127 family)
MRTSNTNSGSSTTGPAGAPSGAKPIAAGSAFVPLRCVDAQGRGGADVQAIVARRFWLRLCGLLALPPLAAGQALLLSPCNSVHTCFMRYRIDVVFIDRVGRVIKLVEALKPWRAAGAIGAAHTLELAAGQALAFGLTPGAFVDVHATRAEGSRP